MEQEKVIKCKDCQTEFVVTDGEQEFFASKGLTLPKRCIPCRKANRARKLQQQGTTEDKFGYGQS